MVHPRLFTCDYLLAMATGNNHCMKMYDLSMERSLNYELNGKEHWKRTVWDIKGPQVKYPACWDFCCKLSQVILMTNHNSIAIQLLATSVQGFRFRTVIRTTGWALCIFHNNTIATRLHIFSRPMAWLVVIMETVGQTNQPCVTTGSPAYLTIRSCW